MSSRPRALSSVYFDLLYVPNVLNIARWVKGRIYLPAKRQTELRCKVGSFRTMWVAASSIGTLRGYVLVPRVSGLEQAVTSGPVRLMPCLSLEAPMSVNKTCHVSSLLVPRLGNSVE